MFTSATYNLIREIAKDKCVPCDKRLQTIFRTQQNGMMILEAEGESLQHALQAMKKQSDEKAEDIGKLKSLLLQKTSEMIDLETSIQGAMKENQNYRDYIASSNETIIKMSGEKTAMIVDIKKMQWTLNDTVAKIKALKSEKNAAIKELNMQIKNCEEEKIELANKYDRLLATQNDIVGLDDHCEADAVRAPASKKHDSRLKHEKNLQSVEREIFVCEKDGCNKKFDKKKSFDRHMLRHKTQIICNECSSAFSQLSDLKRHMLRHTGEKPFSCDFCPKTFAQKGNLKHHLKVHH